MAPRGYTEAFVDEVRAAAQDKVGVKLALICIERDIPVVDVAEFLGLTRTTIYSWFRGRTNVPTKHFDKVQELVDKLK